METGQHLVVSCEWSPDIKTLQVSRDAPKLHQYLAIFTQVVGFFLGLTEMIIFHVLGPRGGRRKPSIYIYLPIILPVCICMFLCSVCKNTVYFVYSMWGTTCPSRSQHGLWGANNPCTMTMPCLATRHYYTLCNHYPHYYAPCDT